MSKSLTMKCSHCGEFYGKYLDHKCDDKNGTVGVKYDEGKPRYSLIPVKPLRAIADVLTIGAKKYPTPDNWKKIENIPERYTDALMRHIEAWRGGEKLDPETNMHHLAHAGCCLLFILWDELKGDK